MRIARRTRRNRRARTPLVVALALGLPLIAASAAVACPGPGQPDRPDRRTPSESGTGTGTGTGPSVDRLLVRVDDGAGAVTTYDLECEGPVALGGTHPQAQAACERLEGLGGPTPRTPPDTFCTQIYGGPQTARVTGTWHGVPVDSSYSRRDGCEIGRWNGMIPVVPDFRARA